MQVWMERRDLGLPGYDGWQALDATPQEESGGRYRCGPVSLAAIRQGQLHLPHDAAFVYAEVNADVVTWFYEESGEGPLGRRLLRTEVDEADVGRAVLTSALAASHSPAPPLDITHTYKAPEGSADERHQIRHAVRQAVEASRAEVRALFGEGQTEEDVEFGFGDLDLLHFGDPVEGCLRLRNASKEERQVEVELSLSVLTYTGSVGRRLLASEAVLRLAGGAAGEVRLRADEADYAAALMHHSEMALDATATVRPTGQVFARRDVFHVVKPPLVLEGEDSARLNQPSTLTIHLQVPGRLASRARAWVQVAQSCKGCGGGVGGGGRMAEGVGEFAAETRKKVVVKAGELERAMVKEAVKLADEGMERSSVEMEIARWIKRGFDSKYPPPWHVVVGRKFGSHVKPERDSDFIFFSIAHLHVLLFQAQT